MRVFSHFDNTFPHVKIFSRSFSDSIAYFNANPLIVSLIGAREWGHMEPLVRSVRLVEALEEYRINGLPLWRYLLAKNFALRNFASNFFNMVFYKKNSGFKYINPLRLVFSYMIYPNFYLSLFYFIFWNTFTIKGSIPLFMMKLSFYITSCSSWIFNCHYLRFFILYTIVISLISKSAATAEPPNIN